MNAADRERLEAYSRDCKMLVDLLAKKDLTDLSMEGWLDGVGSEGLAELIVDGMDGEEVRTALIELGALPPRPTLCGGATDPAEERKAYEAAMRKAL